MGPLFGDLACGHQLTEVAAGRCIATLRDWVGHGVFAGRLGPEQQRLVDSHPAIQAGPMAGADGLGQNGVKP